MRLKDHTAEHTKPSLTSSRETKSPTFTCRALHSQRSVILSGGNHNSVSSMTYMSPLQVNNVSKIMKSTIMHSGPRYISTPTLTLEHQACPDEPHLNRRMIPVTDLP